MHNPIRNSSVAYGSIAKMLHWLLAVLIISMLAYGFLLDKFPKNFQGLAYNLHKLIGVAIFSLAVLRILWTSTNTKPLPITTSPWQRWCARFVHYTLYLLLLLMPLSGWIGSVASGRAPHIGNVELTLPISPDPVLKTICFTVHYWVAYLLLALISCHVLVTFYHHFVKQDETLRRMLPSKI